MQDRRHPLIGQVIVLQAPTLAGGTGSPQQFEVTEIRGLTAVLSPVGDVPAPVLRPGVPAVVSFGPEDDRRHLDGIVLEGPWDGDVVLVRLPKLPERRAHPRYEEHLGVEIQLIEDAPRPTTPLAGKAMDVSAGGLRALVRKFLPAKQRAFVSIEVPEGQPVIGVAEVISDAIRAQEGGFEVRFKFTTMADEERGRMLRHLSGGMPTTERAPLPPDNYHLEAFPAYRD
jgi:hypothetical protein